MSDYDNEIHDYTLPTFNVDDFVLCLGQGDTVFKIIQSKDSNLYCIMKDSGIIHGWVLGELLIKLKPTQVIITQTWKSRF